MADVTLSPLNKIEMEASTMVDLEGLKKALASIGATLSSFALNDILQTVAVIIAIISGALAIKHYLISIKLNKLKYEKLKAQ